jgi:hypothetical protein
MQVDTARSNSLSGLWCASARPPSCVFAEYATALLDFTGHLLLYGALFHI